MADVGKQVPISRPKHKSSPELKRIFAHLVLPMSGSAGALASRHVVATQHVENGRAAQPCNTVGLPLFVDEKRERDSCLLPKQPGVIHVAQANGSQARTPLAELRFVLAQLRDVLAAEDSTVMPKKGDHRRPVGPERAQPDLVTLAVGQGDRREAGTEGRAKHRNILKPFRRSTPLDEAPRILRDLRDSPLSDSLFASNASRTYE